MMMPDYALVQRYMNKRMQAKKRGIDFEMSFTSFKNIYRAKHCFYTGVLLTPPKTEPGVPNPPTSLTIDRIDRNRGYVKGNVVACCYDFNQKKARWENNPTVDTTQAPRAFAKMFKALDDLCHGLRDGITPKIPNKAIRRKPVQQ